MSYSTVMIGPERRRRWSEEQKQDLLVQAFGPGGNVTETARRAEYESARRRGRAADHLQVASAATLEGMQHTRGARAQTRFGSAFPHT